MSKFNPLFQNNNKKSVEVVRPQIIQNTITQTKDNIVIDKLINDKVLIGNGDKIISSQYSIKDLIQETKKLIPPPLQNGDNILIKDNKISSLRYDDTNLKKIIEENHKMHEKLITNISQDTTNLKNQIKANSENLLNSLNLLKKQVDEEQKKGDIIKEEIKNISQHYDKEIKINNGKINDINESNMIYIKVINNKINDLEVFYNEKLELLKTSYENDKEEYNKMYELLNKKIDDINETTKNKIEYNMEMVSEKINNINSINNEKFINFEKKIDNKINNTIEFLNKKTMKEIESRDEKIMNINKNVDNIYKDVVILKESNPQSKNLQKIIQKLTDKVSLIDSHFKFNLPK
jgi:hypothetical protein